MAPLLIILDQYHWFVFHLHLLQFLRILNTLVEDTTLDMHKGSANTVEFF